MTIKMRPTSTSTQTCPVEWWARVGIFSPTQSGPGEVILFQIEKPPQVDVDEAKFVYNYDV